MDSKKESDFDKLKIYEKDQEKYFSSEKDHTSFIKNFKAKLLPRGEGKLKADKAGTRLGKEFCENAVKGEDKKKQQECSEGDRVMARKINNLPIFLIVGHSSYDVFIKRDRETGQLVPTTPPHSKQTYFELPKNTNNIAANKFAVYTSPAGTWGLLADFACEQDPGHLLRATDKQIRNALFSKGNYQTRMIVEKVRENILGVPRSSYGITGKESFLDPAFFVPGSMVLEKGHQFFGDKLSGNGFGIIRLNSTKLKGSEAINTAKELLEAWGEGRTNEEEEEEEEDEGDDIYYISDNGKLTKNDSKLEKLIRSKAKKEEEVFMSDILREGDPGIYISLSCSVLRISIEDRAGSNEFFLLKIDRDAPHTTSFFKLYQAVGKTINQTIIPSRGQEWDAMAAKLNYKSRVPGARGVEQVSAIVQTLAAAKDDKEASQAVLVGKPPPLTRSRMKKSMKILDEAYWELPEQRDTKASQKAQPGGRKKTRRKNRRRNRRRRKKRRTRKRKRRRRKRTRKRR